MIAGDATDALLITGRNLGPHAGLMWQVASGSTQPHSASCKAILTPISGEEIASYTSKERELGLPGKESKMQRVRAAHHEKEQHLRARTIALREELMAAESLCSSLRVLLREAEVDLNQHLSTFQRPKSQGDGLPEMMMGVESWQVWPTERSPITADLIEILDDS